MNSRSAVVWLGIAATLLACDPNLSQQVETAPPPPEPGPVHIEARNTEPPSWLAPAREEVLPPAKFKSFDLAYGGSIAILKTTGGYLLAKADQGLVRRIEPPVEKPSWIGADGRNRIFVADKAGALHRSDDLGQTWDKLPGVSGALSWDAGAVSLIAAVTRDALHVSRDGGRTFHKFASPRKAPLARVALRMDGVIAVQSTKKDGRRLWLSHASHGNFTPSRLRIPLPIARDGSWIWNGHSACPVVLAADGRRWATMTSGTMARWSQLAQPRAYGTPRTSRVLPSLFSPEMPELPPKERGLRRYDCPVPEKLGSLSVVGRGLGATATGLECTGLGCLEGTFAPLPRPTAHWYALATDATCAPEDGDETGTCTPLKTVNPGHALHWNDDTQTVDVLELPQGCQPLRIESVGGLGLLWCANEPEAVWTSQGTDWKREEDAPPALEPSDRVSTGPDGTLIVASCVVVHNTEKCRVYVRAPKERGAANVWSRIELNYKEIVRPIDGGRLLGVAPVDGDKIAMVRLIEHDGSSLVLASSLMFEQPVRDARFDDEARQILFTTGPLDNTQEVVLWNNNRTKGPTTDKGKSDEVPREKQPGADGSASP